MCNYFYLKNFYGSSLFIFLVYIILLYYFVDATKKTNIYLLILKSFYFFFLNLIITRITVNKLVVSIASITVKKLKCRRNDGYQ